MIKVMKVNIFWSMVNIIIVSIVNKYGLRFKNTSCLRSFEKSVIITTDDPDDSFIRVLRKQLCHNDLRLHKENIKYLKQKIHLHISDVALIECSTSRSQCNVFELQIIMKLKGTIVLSDHNVYPLSLQINSARYSLSTAAFTDAALQESIISDMYDKAAQKLIKKLEKIILNRIQKIEFLI